MPSEDSPSTASEAGVANLALAGLRVVDMSRLVAGNTLTQMLADFGADVIKVEPPEGDTLRAWRVRGVDTHWKVYGRGKRSLALDFRHKQAHDILFKLAVSAAVLIESFRPGTLEEMGLSPASLLEANPRLIIVRISGFGQDGPYRRRPGFGTLVEGMSGFASMNGFEDRPPLLPPMFLADGVAGLQGVGALLVALREVEVNGGRGQVIDLPLFDPLFSILGPQAANYQLTGQAKPRTGNRSTNSAPRNAYETKDGRWVCLSASTQRMTERLLKSLGRSELIEDPRFRTNEARLENHAALDAIIAAFVGARTQNENVAFFDAAEVTIGPIYDISQIIDDPHVRARGLLQDFPDDQMGTIPMHAVPIRLSRTPGRLERPAPRIGEHGREVLSQIGYSEADVESLIESACVFEDKAVPTPRRP